VTDLCPHGTTLIHCSWCRLDALEPEVATLKKLVDMLHRARLADAGSIKALWERVIVLEQASAATAPGPRRRKRTAAGPSRRR